MDERTQKIADDLAKQFPGLAPGRAAALASSVKPGVGGAPNDDESFQQATKAAREEHAEASHPTPAMPALAATSDNQRAFAEKVRDKHVAAVRRKIAAIEGTVANVRADGGDPTRFVAQQQQLAKWLGALSRATSAAKILDTQHIDFSNISPAVTDIVAKKLGVQV